MTSKFAETPAQKHIYFPAIETVSEAWPSRSSHGNERGSLQIRVKSVHQLLLSSISSVQIVMTAPQMSLRTATTVGHRRYDLSWVLSSLTRFWSIAGSHLQESLLSSQLNWSGIFLDIFGQLFSSFTSKTFPQTVAPKVSSLMSQIVELYLLRLEASQLSHLDQKLLCKVCLEVTRLCQKSTRWSALILEQVAPALRKCEVREQKNGRELEVRQFSRRSWIHGD